jgi:hypothetical protein
MVNNMQYVIFQEKAILNKRNDPTAYTHTYHGPFSAEEVESKYKAMFAARGLHETVVKIELNKPSEIIFTGEENI